VLHKQVFATSLCRCVASALPASAGVIVCPSPVSPAQLISIQPSQQIVSVGHEFSVDVGVCNATDVLAYFLNFSFAPGIVSATLVAERDFLRQGGATVFLPGIVDNVAGTIAAVEDNFLPQAPLPAVSGNGTLVTLTFVARASGTTRIDLFNSALRETTAAVTPLTVGATVIVIPEPPNIGVVVAAGLISALLCRRRIGAPFYSKSGR
jgi:hypothetical protein